ncbi:MAG TPA: hypothetical protein VN361_07600, partial [Oxalicibacterium sp.]|nr:hypothetical protein [Oxalicibacterium sp.]
LRRRVLYRGPARLFREFDGMLRLFAGGAACIDDLAKQSVAVDDGSHPVAAAGNIARKNARAARSQLDL